jgi:3-oxoacyl-[acyl-carrier protein] reductase
VSGGAPASRAPLAGRVALVTGVSRRVGIGMAVARRLAGLGAGLFVTSWTAHDREQPWGLIRAASTRSWTSSGRWGQPDDAARLVGWLCTDDALWVTGQVINSEGGFRPFR